MTIEIGVQLFPGEPEQLVEEASIVEALGLHSVWVADHFFGGGRDRSWRVPEVLSVLGAISHATTRVRVGTCVLSLQKRDAASVAHAALTLSALSEGRFDLGIGTGFGPDLRAFGVDTSAPAARFAESIEVIRRLFQATEEQPASFDGRWSQLDDAFLNVSDSAPPPISVASVSPRMLEVTARLADGWLPFGLTPDLYRDALAALRPERTPFVPGLWIPVFMEGPGEDRSAEAEATGRLYLSMAPEVLRQVSAGKASEPLPGATGWDKALAEKAAEAIPVEVARSSTLHGSPQQCAEGLMAFVDAGCRRFVLRITDPQERGSVLRPLAEALLPAISAG